MTDDVGAAEQRTGVERASAENQELPVAAPATNTPVERVTVASRPSKDLKKVAAGRAGAAARKAKHERLLQELRAAKESFRVPEERNGDGTPPKVASNIHEHVAAVVPVPSEQQQDHADKRQQNRTGWSDGTEWRMEWRYLCDAVNYGVTMTTPAADGKMLVNALYPGAVVSGIAMGYARLGKMAMGGSTPKLDFTPRDVGMVVADITLAMATKAVLVK